MKTTLLTIFVVFAVVGTAFAVPSAGDRKALCKKYSDKYVWVEKSEACIPVNPCLSDAISIRNAYCDNIFADVGVKNYGVAEELVRQYIGGSFAVNKVPGSNRYVAATQQAGDALSVYDYRVFEFQDVGINGDDTDDAAFRAACLAYNGNYNLRGCFGTNASCTDLATLATFVYGADVNVVEQETGCVLQN